MNSVLYLPVQGCITRYNGSTFLTTGNIVVLTSMLATFCARAIQKRTDLHLKECLDFILGLDALGAFEDEGVASFLVGNLAKFPEFSKLSKLSSIHDKCRQVVDQAKMGRWRQQNAPSIFAKKSPVRVRNQPPHTSARHPDVQQSFCSLFSSLDRCSAIEI
jgi:hypothetical protein